MANLPGQAAPRHPLSGGCRACAANGIYLHCRQGSRIWALRSLYLFWYICETNCQHLLGCSFSVVSKPIFRLNVHFAAFSSSTRFAHLLTACASNFCTRFRWNFLGVFSRASTWNFNFCTAWDFNFCTDPDSKIINESGKSAVLLTFQDSFQNLLKCCNIIFASV